MGILGEELNRIFISFQVCPFRVVFSTDWSALEEGSGVTAAGPAVSQGVPLSGFAAFLGLELKHS